jgi:hypothetical protein
MDVANTIGDSRRRAAAAEPYWKIITLPAHPIRQHQQR